MAGVQGDVLDLARRCHVNGPFSPLTRARGEIVLRKLQHFHEARYPLLCRSGRDDRGLIPRRFARNDLTVGQANVHSLDLRVRRSARLQQPR